MNSHLFPCQLSFSFKPSSKDFFVDEVPLRPYSEKGKFLIIRVQKRHISTWEMLDIFASYLEIKTSEIGYSGLKDKYATTQQYLSFSKRHLKALKKFFHQDIVIKEFLYHHKKLQVGELLGNNFVLHLYDVDTNVAGKLQKCLTKFQKYGIANYFGKQRFGSGDALEQAKKMINDEIFIKDKKLKHFLISVYQSDLFNKWLNKRVELSDENGLKLLKGDVYIDKNSKFFISNKPLEKEFALKKVIPTGLLPGRDLLRAKDQAREIEELFDDIYLVQKGYRREAVVYPQNIKTQYDPKKKKMVLSFFLPKGAYATVLIEALEGRK